MLISWQDPPAWDPVAGVEAAPPGRGNFLVKVGGRAGIPFHVALTETEHALQRHQQALARQEQRPARRRGW